MQLQAETVGDNFSLGVLSLSQAQATLPDSSLLNPRDWLGIYPSGRTFVNEEGRGECSGRFDIGGIAYPPGTMCSMVAPHEVNIPL